MSDGYNLVLPAPGRRETAHRIVDTAPQGSRFSVKPPRRTIPQNDKFWTLLGELAAAKPQGRVHTPKQWRTIILDAIGVRADWVPSLDGTNVVNTGVSSTTLSIGQMSEAIEQIYAYGAQHGVEFTQ